GVVVHVDQARSEHAWRPPACGPPAEAAGAGSAARETRPTGWEVIICWGRGWSTRPERASGAPRSGAGAPTNPGGRRGPYGSIGETSFFSSQISLQPLHSSVQPLWQVETHAWRAVLSFGNRFAQSTTQRSS